MCCQAKLLLLVALLAALALLAHGHPVQRANGRSLVAKKKPTVAATSKPTHRPTPKPTPSTMRPTSSKPTKHPTAFPTKRPTSHKPTYMPTAAPTKTAARSKIKVQKWVPPVKSSKALKFSGPQARENLTLLGKQALARLSRPASTRLNTCVALFLRHALANASRQEYEYEYEADDSNWEDDSPAQDDSPAHDDANWEDGERGDNRVLADRANIKARMTLRRLRQKHT